MSGMSTSESTPSAFAIGEGPQIGPLSAVGAAAAEHALSSETRRAYGRALRQVTEQLDGRPMDDHSLSTALADLAADGAGRAKLSQVAAAVRFGARLAGRPDPVGPSCDLVLRAHRRTTPAGASGGSCRLGTRRCCSPSGCNRRRCDRVAQCRDNCRDERRPVARQRGRIASSRRCRAPTRRCRNAYCAPQQDRSEWRRGLPVSWRADDPTHR